jgi:hypothetical protein
MNMTPLNGSHLPAMHAHYMALPPEDFYLRFGALKTPGGDAHVQLYLGLQVKPAMRTSSGKYFGAWDASGKHLQVIVGINRVGDASSNTFESSISALPEVRGGLVMGLSDWLRDELLKQGATDLVMTYQEGNRPVQRLVEKLGMAKEHIEGVVFYRMKLDAHSQVMELWQTRFGQLLEAAKNELAEVPSTAKL